MEKNVKKRYCHKQLNLIPSDSMAADRFITSIISRIFSPEFGKKIVVKLMKYGVTPSLSKSPPSPSLQQKLFGISFENPLGMAAGFDKDAEIFRKIFRLGFGFVEVGSVTLKPQKGNKNKRMWSLPQDKAVINRFGLPSHGLEKIRHRLKNNNGTKTLGVNIAYNRHSTSAEKISEDYYYLAKGLADRVSYITVNVSCPNTKDGKDLYSTEYLPKILKSVQDGINSVNPNLPFMLKLSPDVNREELISICNCAKEHNVSALIVGNTTTKRPNSLQSPHKGEEGGLSGVPLFASSTERLAQSYLLCGDSIPLIGVGGIASADDAYTKIKAGASLLQLYTGLYYQGRGLINNILIGLPKLLQQDGYHHISEAVGVEAKKLAGDFNIPTVISEVKPSTCNHISKSVGVEAKELAADFNIPIGISEVPPSNYSHISEAVIASMDNLLNNYQVPETLDVETERLEAVGVEAKELSV